MPFTSTKDTEFGDCYFDNSKTDKRLKRATLKSYEKTGTYVFLKLLKKGPKNTSLNRDVRYLCKTLRKSVRLWDVISAGLGRYGREDT